MMPAAMAERIPVTELLGGAAIPVHTHWRGLAFKVDGDDLRAKPAMLLGPLQRVQYVGAFSAAMVKRVPAAGVPAGVPELEEADRDEAAVVLDADSGTEGERRRNREAVTDVLLTGRSPAAAADERQVFIEVVAVSGESFIGKLARSGKDPDLSMLRPGLVVLVAFDPAAREELSLPDDVLAVRASWLAAV